MAGSPSCSQTSINNRWDRRLRRLPGMEGKRTFTHEERQQVFTFFEGVLRPLKEPIHFEYIRGHVTKAPSCVKRYVSIKCKGDKLLEYFRVRKNYFVVENTCVSLIKNPHLNKQQKGPPIKENHDTRYEWKKTRFNYRTESISSTISSCTMDSDCNSISDNTENLQDEDYSDDQYLTNLTTVYSDSVPDLSWKLQQENYTHQYFTDLLTTRETINIDSLTFDSLPKKVKWHLTQNCKRKVRNYFSNFSAKYSIDRDGNVSLCKNGLISETCTYLKGIDVPDSDPISEPLKQKKTKIDPEILKAQNYLETIEFFASILEKKKESICLEKLGGCFSQASNDLKTFVKFNYKSFKMFFQDAHIVFRVNSNEEVTLSRNYKTHKRCVKSVIDSAKSNLIPLAWLKPDIDCILLHSLSCDVPLVQDREGRLLKFIFTVELLCLEMAEKSWINFAMCQAMAVCYFERVLDTSTSQLLAVSQLQGVLGKAPSEVSTFMRKWYKGENLECFFLENDEFQLDLPIVTLKSNFWDIFHQRIQFFLLVYHNTLKRNFTKLYETNLFVKYLKETFAFLYDVCDFLNQKKPMKPSRLEGVITNFSNCYAWVNASGRESSNEKIKNFLSAFTIFEFSPENYISFSGNMHSEFLLAWLRCLKKSFTDTDPNFLSFSKFVKNNQKFDLDSDLKSKEFHLDSERIELMYKTINSTIERVILDKSEIAYHDLARIFPKGLLAEIVNAHMDSRFIISNLIRSKKFLLSNGKIKLADPTDASDQINGDNNGFVEVMKMVQSPNPENVTKAEALGIFMKVLKMVQSLNPEILAKAETSENLGNIYDPPDRERSYSKLSQAEVKNSNSDSDIPPCVDQNLINNCDRTKKRKTRPKSPSTKGIKISVDFLKKVLVRKISISDDINDEEYFSPSEMVVGLDSENSRQEIDYSLPSSSNEKYGNADGPQLNLEVGDSMKNHIESKNKQKLECSLCYSQNENLRNEGLNLEVDGSTKNQLECQNIQKIVCNIPSSQISSSGEESVAILNLEVNGSIKNADMVKNNEVSGDIPSTEPMNEELGKCVPPFRNEFIKNGCNATSVSNSGDISNNQQPNKKDPETNSSKTNDTKTLLEREWLDLLNNDLEVPDTRVNGSSTSFKKNGLDLNKAPRKSLNENNSKGPDSFTENLDKPLKKRATLNSADVKVSNEGNADLTCIHNMDPSTIFDMKNKAEILAGKFFKDITKVYKYGSKSYDLSLAKQIFIASPSVIFPIKKCDLPNTNSTCSNSKAGDVTKLSDCKIEIIPNFDENLSLSTVDFSIESTSIKDKTQIEHSKSFSRMDTGKALERKHLDDKSLKSNKMPENETKCLNSPKVEDIFMASPSVIFHSKNNDELNTNSMHSNSQMDDKAKLADCEVEINQDSDNIFPCEVDAFDRISVENKTLIEYPLQPISAKIMLLTANSCIAVAEIKNKNKNIYFLKCVFNCEDPSCSSDCFDDLKIDDVVSCFVPPTVIPNKMWVAFMVSKETLSSFKEEIDLVTNVLMDQVQNSKTIHSVFPQAASCASNEKQYSELGCQTKPSDLENSSQTDLSGEVKLSQIVKCISSQTSSMILKTVDIQTENATVSRHCQTESSLQSNDTQSQTEHTGEIKRESRVDMSSQTGITGNVSLSSETVDTNCQTISTGTIMATKYYHH